MTEQLKDYFDALERLKKRGAKITNDSVSLEAGRKKGSIKRSRPVFSGLIAAIGQAASEQISASDIEKQRLRQAKADAERYRTLWEESLCREVSLIKQLWDEREEWARKEAALTGAKISSILGGKIGLRKK